MKIRVKIYGGQGAGKTRLANLIESACGFCGYSVSIDDGEDIRGSKEAEVAVLTVQE